MKHASGRHQSTFMSVLKTKAHNDFYDTNGNLEHNFFFMITGYLTLNKFSEKLMEN